MKVVGTHCDMTSFTEDMKIKVKDSIHRHMDEHKAYLATELVKVMVTMIFCDTGLVI